MKATYYVPRKPDSVPFINKEAGIVEIVMDGEFIEISYDLFTKMFREAEYEEPDENVVYDSEGVHPKFFSVDPSNLDSTMSSLKEMAQELKSFGVTKEHLKEQMNKILDGSNLSYAKSTAMNLIEELYGD